MQAKETDKYASKQTGMHALLDRFTGKLVDRLRDRQTNGQTDPITGENC